MSPRAASVCRSKPDVEHELAAGQRLLATLVDELVRSAEAPRAEQRVTVVLHEVVRVARAQIAAEEQLMVESGFPGLPGHARAHEVLVAALLDVAGRVATEPPPRAVIAFLRTRIDGHLLTFDRELAQFLSSMASDPCDRRRG